MPFVRVDDIKRLTELQLGVKRVNDRDRFVEDLGAESADIANLVAAVEEKYQIEIKETEIPHILTPHDLFELINNRIQ